VNLSRSRAVYSLRVMVVKKRLSEFAFCEAKLKKRLSMFIKLACCTSLYASLPFVSLKAYALHFNKTGRW